MLPEQASAEMPIYWAWWPMLPSLSSRLTALADSLHATQRNLSMRQAFGCWGQCCMTDCSRFRRASIGNCSTRSEHGRTDNNQQKTRNIFKSCLEQNMTANLALIGCGAIARNFYLPALARLRTKFGNIWLVDPSDHALTAAKSIIPGRTASRLKDITDAIHLVIVATPNQLHFPVACEALSRGADVLIEKPFVIWPDDGRQILKVAAESNRVIAINQTRRYFPVAGALRNQITESTFGA